MAPPARMNEVTRGVPYTVGGGERVRPLLDVVSVGPILGGGDCFLCPGKGLPMSGTLLERHEDAVILQIRTPLSRSLLQTEQAIQQALNAAGLLATTEALQQFDTDGSPLQIGSSRY